MKAHDIMTWGVISAAPDASVLKAAKLMLEHKISGLPVVDAKGDLVGIVTEGDFVRHRITKISQRQRKVHEIMTPRPFHITGDTPLEEIIELMERYRIKRLPVVDDRQVIGMVSRANLLQGLVNVAAEMERSPEAASPDPH